MSYILDALRRADAERSRGSVPGLHAQSLPDAEPAARDYRPLAWMALAAGAVMLAVAGVLVFGPWRPRAPAAATPPLAPAPQLARTDRADAGPAYAQGETPPARPGELAPAARPVEPPIPERAAWRGADAPVSTRADAPVSTSADADAATARGPAPGTTPARPAVAAEAARPLPAGMAPRLEQRAAQGRVAVLAPRATATPAGRADDGAAPTSPAARAAAANLSAADPAPAAVEHYGPPVAAAPARAPAAVPDINDLPPTLKAELPRLAVGGSIYSEVPAARMVILNGQVFHEGDRPAPDTVVEQIRLKSAVLSYRGQRYQVNF